MLTELSALNREHLILHPTRALIYFLFSVLLIVVRAVLTQLHPISLFLVLIFGLSKQHSRPFRCPKYITFVLIRFIFGLENRI